MPTAGGRQTEAKDYSSLAAEFERYGQFFMAQAQAVADGNFDADGNPIIIEDGLFGKLAAQAATNLTLAGFCRTLEELSDGHRTNQDQERRTPVRRELRTHARHSALGRPLRPTMPPAPERDSRLVLRHQSGHDDGISSGESAGNHPKVIPASPFILCPKCKEPIQITRGNSNANFGLVIAHFIISHPEMPEAWSAFAPATKSRRKPTPTGAERRAET